MSYKVGTIINRNYTYNGNLYTAKITFKRMRNIVLRLGKEENALRLSAPYYSSMERIDKMVSEFLPKLIKRSKKVDAALPYGDGWVYILGEKIEAEFEDEKEREMYLKKRKIRDGGIPALQSKGGEDVLPLWLQLQEDPFLMLRQRAHPLPNRDY